MSLVGEYEPSRNERDRRQVELYEASNGKEGGTMLGKPISAPRHPAWYHSIVANPLVELQDRATKHEMHPREIFGEEKDEWWKRADAAYPEFPTYRGRAGREIPVILLEPF